MERGKGEKRTEGREKEKKEVKGWACEEGEG